MNAQLIGEICAAVIAVAGAVTAWLSKNKAQAHAASAAKSLTTAKVWANSMYGKYPPPIPAPAHGEVPGELVRDDSQPDA
jgi:hypothetical protein